ncbi:MAG: hypothetical protein U0228_27850 [Myxococcaceae bacterium]
MSLLPDDASFHEKVQACFVAFRRRGVSLSALDAELLDQWAAHEVPFEVIARGIRKAAETHLWDAAADEAGPDSLRSCRREVESEIKRYVRHTAGRTAAPKPGESDDFLAERFKTLKASIKKLTRPTAPAWLAKLQPPTDLESADRLEALTAFLLLRALPFAQRRSLLREARQLVEKAPPMSAAAFAESLRFHRVAVTHQAWSNRGS